jgi:hypothetical protein
VEQGLLPRYLGLEVLYFGPGNEGSPERVADRRCAAITG